MVLGLHRTWLRNSFKTDMIPAHNRYEDEGVNEDVNLFPGSKISLDDSTQRISFGGLHDGFEGSPSF